MKFEVKNRFSGEVQFTAEIDCAEDAHISIKLGLAVKWAIKAGANLAGANLAGAYLADAYLARANLARANLAGANLARAIKVDPKDIPVVEKIDAKILAAIEAGGALGMGSWHSCDTTHCRAGWAIHLAGEAGYTLEKEYGPRHAGAMIYRASRPGFPAPHFYVSNEHALEDIRKHAALQNSATV